MFATLYVCLTDDKSTCVHKNVFVCDDKSTCVQTNVSVCMSNGCVCLTDDKTICIECICVTHRQQKYTFKKENYGCQMVCACHRRQKYMYKKKYVCQLGMCVL